MFKWIFEYDGQKKTLMEWCKIYRREYSSACKKARKDQSIEQILFSSHGASKNGRREKIYSVWLSVRNRCKNPKDPWYGSKGVKICERWNDFNNFRVDMGEMPTPFHQIDRIDSSKDYTPDNCRWATPLENSNNKRNNRLIEFGGEKMTLSQWARKLNISVQTLKNRLDMLNMPLEIALTSRKYKLRK